MMGYVESSLLAASSCAHLPSVIGKAEGASRDWHGHVTAITVGPEYRRLGLANKMMKMLEYVSEKVYNGYFVDLYVRSNNDVALTMYEKMGYSVYRRVVEYYEASSEVDTGQPDANDAFGETIPAKDDLLTDSDVLDMRKPLSRDVAEAIHPCKRKGISCFSDKCWIAAI